MPQPGRPRGPDILDTGTRLVARARQIVARRGSTLIVEAAREGFELVLDPVAKR